VTGKIVRVATVLAATEVVPAEWRDLSELLEHCGGPDGILHGDITGTGREAELRRYVRRTIDRGRIAYWEERIHQLLAERPTISIELVTDPSYPANLRRCYDRPPFIAVDGSVSPVDDQSLAIVGSRKAGAEALSVAAEAARRAAEAGITVVSGLARGVDGAAHHGALARTGRTIAVIGSGIDYAIYPPEHTILADRIRDEGAIISQFRPGSPSTRSSFVLRNSVISGLSCASLLIQADANSGTLTEAEFAIKQGRAVYLWGPIAAAEPWALRLRQEPGVFVVSDLDDVVEKVIAARVRSN
jgi:DNA processing protein